MEGVTAQSDSPSPPREPLPPPHGIRVRRQVGSLLHSGVTVRGFYGAHALGAAVPLMAAVIFFGWRALATLGLVFVGATIALLSWRQIGRRGRQIHFAEAAWFSLLTGMMLPAHLATDDTPVTEIAAWPIPVSAGFLTVGILWLTGGTSRLHASVCSVLLLMAAFWSLLTPFAVLDRVHAVRGDLLKVEHTYAYPANVLPWQERRPAPAGDAYRTTPASYWLTRYTRGSIQIERARVPLHELLRDRMPPLQDLVIGGHPTPIGQASLIAVVVGGLFLLYRGVIDYRIPLLMLLTMYAALLVLPTPTVITEKGAYFRWFIPREPDVGWAAVTYVNYQLAAGPAAFVAFFVATAPGVRPLGRLPRAIFAVLIGLFSAAAQLYLSTAIGPYVALLLATLVAPLLDRWMTPRTLV